VISAKPRFLESIAQIDAASWNSLLRDGQPFLRHEFLLALEQSGCAVPHTGWTPRLSVQRKWAFSARTNRIGGRCSVL
jgi:predicted N-acyltransferase